MTRRRVIGLAYVRRDQSDIGTKFVIRVDGAQEVEAMVVKIPFYDPEGRRQNGDAVKKEVGA